MSDVEWYHARSDLCHYRTTNMFLKLCDVAKTSTHEDAMWMRKYFVVADETMDIMNIFYALNELRGIECMATCLCYLLRTSDNNFSHTNHEEMLENAARTGHVFSLALYCDNHLYIYIEIHIRELAYTNLIDDPFGCFVLAHILPTPYNKTARWLLKRGIHLGYDDTDESTFIMDIFPYNEMAYLFGKMSSWRRKAGNCYYGIYIHTNNAYRSAALTWILVGRKIKVNKDVILIIAKLVWNSRSEAQYI